MYWLLKADRRLGSDDRDAFSGSSPNSLGVTTYEGRTTFPYDEPYTEAADAGRDAGWWWCWCCKPAAGAGCREAGRPPRWIDCGRWERSAT